MIPENTCTIDLHRGRWKKTDGSQMERGPEVNTSYIIEWFGESEPTAPSSCWLACDRSDNYYEAEQIEQVSLCYGNITSVSWEPGYNGRKDWTITFFVTHRMQLTDVPSLLPSQPFPAWLKDKIDNHLTGVAYLGGSACVKSSGDYFFLTSPVHGIDEQMVAVKHNNDIRIILAIHHNDWEHLLLWRSIGNYDCPEAFTHYFRHDKNNVV